MSAEDEIARLHAEMLAEEEALTAALAAVRAVEDRKRAIRDAITDARIQANRERLIQEAAQRAEAERKAAEIQANVLKQRDADYDEIAKGKLWAQRMEKYPHQLYGAKYFAAAKRAICADDMGVGKTIQSLGWLDLVQSERALVFCPGDTMSNYVDEIGEWTDRPVGTIGRLPKKEVDTIINTYLAYAKRFVLIINFEAWNRNRAILDKLISVRFDSIIVDEAHNIKETDGVWFQGVEKVVLAENSCPNCHDEIALSRDRTWRCALCGWDSAFNNMDKIIRDRRSVENILLMTGTPILNRPTEIYPLLKLVNDQTYRNKINFIRDYCTRDANDKLVWRPGGESVLANRIQGFYLRRTKESAGIKLPKQHAIIHELEFDAESYPRQAELMKMLHEDAAIKINDDESMDVFSMLALITRERQAACWPGGITITEPIVDIYGAQLFEPNSRGKMVPVTRKIPVGDQYHESQKIDAAVKLTVELVDADKRVVWYTQFKTASVQAEKQLKALGIRVVRYDGDTPNDVRDMIKRNANRQYGEPPLFDVILAHYKTGGVGLNLTAFTEMIILDREWNPGKNAQAYGRLDRIGQTEETRVHIFRLIGKEKWVAIDRWMDRLIQMKEDLVEKFGNAMDEKAENALQMEKELRAILRGDFE